MDQQQIEKELNFLTSRSSGSGGQHVNKTETKVEARFEVDASGALTPAEKRKVHEALANRISKEGILSVTSDARRSQVLNRGAAVKKLLRLIKKALRVRKRRKGPPQLKANPKKRLERKRRHSEKKALRGKIKI
ncbi:MAG: alternative ribosome rescue aminoacyl-tRNA hydrolase ArfB [Phaeodactylibacter sp.]|uniref:alternative ribosome rescue aminoacyl-tRNA hydrolase ArfB n=1 Tax=Phaeodactylibacter sp. TaxID=1940289 RepID=UPI0032EE459F